jgi:hypothetical protein
MSGNLYQLQTSAVPGQIMVIAGPFDTFGRVIKLQDSGYHLIRGLGHQKPKEGIVN